MKIIPLALSVLASLVALPAIASADSRSALSTVHATTGSGNSAVTPMRSHAATVLKAVKSSKRERSASATACALAHGSCVERTSTKSATARLHARVPTAERSVVHRIEVVAREARDWSRSPITLRESRRDRH
ncbi:MAG: hypothetical protein U0271_04270 [Polyangiaceae bacterium]